VVGSNPGTVMDVIDASYYIQENNKNKGYQIRRSKKQIFKNQKHYLYFLVLSFVVFGLCWSYFVIV
jgi:hypothetical protein